ncbi:response regulator [Parvularcula flava]|uniref:Response regulator n=1 Tax=Aquisalinus luteolus TaxID=1566827 RepID=A0A8J3ETK9_9PROT|nr:response regulator [Aquisalinus luteolus]NHK27067.1 response regulator [Aquisalinus luteolus]GGH94265.1 DNA-binding response regulator [Aquisalinus luteolus]
MSKSAIAPDEDAPHILIVDDDSRICELLKRFLKDNGYHATTASDAAHARKLMAGLAFDLLILDVMMPGETGFELTQSLRETSAVPIILLTARGQSDDRIEGLERGADDYMAKPFEPRELLLRIRNLLKRREGDGTRKAEYSFGDCVFHPARGELKRAGEVVKLTSGELDLLRTLVQKPGAPISRAALAEKTSAAMDRSIDVQVTRLRKKIEDDPRNPMILQTVRGVGYALMVD